MKKRLVLISLLAVFIGANALLPPPLPQPDSGEIIAPLNDIWGIEKS